MNQFPYINWTHDNGPLLICSDGTKHLLTKVESLWMKIGFTNLDQLNEQYNNEPTRG